MDLALDVGMYLSPEGDAPRRTGQGPSKDHEKETAHPFLILLVEDEEDLLYLLRDRFEWEGYQVETAASKAEAEALLGGITPSLVVLDLMLPDGSGMDLLTSLRAAKGTANVPVLVLTGLGDDETKEMALARGADRFLTKPSSAERLLGEIRSLLLSKEIS